MPFQFPKILHFFCLLFLLLCLPPAFTVRSNRDKMADPEFGKIQVGRELGTIRVWVVNYLNVEGFKHLAEPEHKKRFTVSLTQVGAGKKEEEIVSVKSDRYDEAVLKIPDEKLKELTREVTEEVNKNKGKNKANDKHAHQMQFKIQAIKETKKGPEPPCLTMDIDNAFALKLLTTDKIVVYSVRDKGIIRVTNHSTYNRPRRAMEFTFSEAPRLTKKPQFKVVKIECHVDHFVSDWEFKIDEDKVERSIAFHETVCPGDNYQVIVEPHGPKGLKELEENNKPKERLGTVELSSSEVKEFHVECDEARFDLPKLNVYKVVWRGWGNKFVCTLDWQKSGKDVNEAELEGNKQKKKHGAEAEEGTQHLAVLRERASTAEESSAAAKRRKLHESAGPSGVPELRSESMKAANALFEFSNQHFELPHHIQNPDTEHANEDEATESDYDSVMDTMTISEALKWNARKKAAGKGKRGSRMEIDGSAALALPELPGAAIALPGAALALPGPIIEHSHTMNHPIERQKSDPADQVLTSIEEHPMEPDVPKSLKRAREEMSGPSSGKQPENVEIIPGSPEHPPGYPVPMYREEKEKTHEGFSEPIYHKRDEQNEEKQPLSWEELSGMP